LPDTEWAKSVKAFVVVRAGAGASAEDLIRHCRSADRELQEAAHGRVRRGAAAIVQPAKIDKEGRCGRAVWPRAGNATK